MDLGKLEQKTSHKKYRVDVKLLFEGGESEDIKPEFVNRVNVEHNFEINLFPMLKLEVMLDHYQYQLIKDNKDIMKVSLLISNTEIGQDPEEEEDMYHHLIKKVFNPIFNEMENLPDEISPEMEIGIDPISHEPTRLFSSIPFSMYLFDEKYELNDNLFNFIAEQTNILGVIGHLVNLSKVDKLLIEKPNNNTIYNQVILPPMNLRNSISYLQDHYGIYTNGCKLYIDFEYTYLLSRDVKHIPRVKGDIEKIIINFLKEDQYTNYDGISKDYIDMETKTQYILTSDECIITGAKQVENYLTGSDLDVINRDTIDGDIVGYDINSGIFRFDEFVDNTNLGNTKKKKIMVTNASNDYVTNEIQNNVDKKDLEITFPLYGVDVNTFKINSEFYFNFSDRNRRIYNGKYYLDRMTYTLKKSGNHECMLVFFGLFRKFRD